MKHLSLRIFLVSAILLIAGCATKPQSDVDTPEYHFRSGMRSVDTGNYNAALSSFQRALDLDKKFVSIEGNVEFSQGKSIIRAEKINVDLVTETVDFEGIKDSFIKN